MKKLVVLGTLILIILFLSIFGVYHYFHSPYDRFKSNRLFVIKNGEALQGISHRLAQAGLLRYPKLFTAMGSLKGFDQKIKAGQYLLHTSMTPLEILDALTKGLVLVQGITIPEGYTVEQIAMLLEKTGIAEKTTVIEASRDPEILKMMKISADSMEGYLFPDTYQFYKGMSPEDILKTMIRRFREVITPQMEKRFGEMGLSIHDVVTLASIIEKETSLEAERPLIASVLLNRLKKGMPLQSDPTVIYFLKDFDGNLTRDHLETPIPYNTYLFKGLPPGPISNPGVASIKAVIYPAITSYLYFVSRNDGSHVFSEDIKDHNHAVLRYQKGRKSIRGCR